MPVSKDKRVSIVSQSLEIGRLTRAKWAIKSFVCFEYEPAAFVFSLDRRLKAGRPPVLVG